MVQYCIMQDKRVTPNMVKRLRAKLKLSRKAFGKRVGVHETTVWRWENNIVTIPKSAYGTLRRLEESAA